MQQLSTSTADTSRAHVLLTRQLVICTDYATAWHLYRLCNRIACTTPTVSTFISLHFAMNIEMANPLGTAYMDQVLRQHRQAGLVK